MTAIVSYTGLPASRSPVSGGAGRPPAPSRSLIVLHSWIGHAACGGRTELFFGPHAERPEERQRREAKARQVCLACPVLELCRDWAREQREYGFWGGESEEERVTAGYPVALPTGRVAQRIRAVRKATAAAGQTTGQWRRPGHDPGPGGYREDPRPLVHSRPMGSGAGTATRAERAP